MGWIGEDWGGWVPSRLLARRTQPGISWASTADWMAVSKSAMVECGLCGVRGVVVFSRCRELICSRRTRILLPIAEERTDKELIQAAIQPDADNCYRLVVASRCLRAACLGPHWCGANMYNLLVAARPSPHVRVLVRYLRKTLVTGLVVSLLPIRLSRKDQLTL
jgi:hypothetical protein